jgi:nitrile hydratase
MNGVHDMGGMHGLGAIPYEPNEPVFHAGWEARVSGLPRAVGAWRRWSTDAFRQQIEQIPGPDYLRMSYYEKWLTALTELSVKVGLITAAELKSGRPEPGSPKQTPALSAEQVAGVFTRNTSMLRPEPAPARYRPGDTVRARNINPTFHTRLPRYVRGRAGTIERGHGAHVFPDSNARNLGEDPQHLYSVRFTARELWGEEASSRDVVYLDLWDSYLEPA